jgi:hypothetical protein
MNHLLPFPSPSFNQILTYLDTSQAVDAYTKKEIWNPEANKHVNHVGEIPAPLPVVHCTHIATKKKEE